MTIEKNANVIFKSYSVVKPLGKGSYGSVYEMYDSEKDEKFALKEVPISSDNVHNFLAEILPDCVVCHESLQQYYPFVISRRPDILENFSIRKHSCPSLSTNDEDTTFNEDTTINDDDYEEFSICKQNSNDDLIKFTNKIYFEDEKVQIEAARKEKLKSKQMRIKNLKKSSNWSMGKKIKNSVVSTSKKFYMYLKTKICDFSLRDFIDFRNHFMFRMIEVEKIEKDQVQIPLDFYKNSIQEDKKVNKKFSLGLFRCILLGLIHLHSFGIAHNDLKSSNILLDSSESFRPKIADFGLKTFCKFSHGATDSYNNLYDYCSNISVCTHPNKNKVEDCKSLIYILYELLYPCRTQSEMLYLLKDLKRLKKVPNDFRALYFDESLLIEKVLEDNTITASSILTMLDEITK
ncbi:Eukaryotic translation initiation factor 2-alpha kinase 2 [Nosema granulosis]|uniref:Eukaryotic translation initiation factor 2-alpha kinase 2 n=1 Tax=Nosema granulosis TaxID=83296 RepID=A0A9P6KYR6_9MICR|nr:Eukaryotic translation initiation factor 2-alpha kinase 2 [Nosema granulosis]